MIRTTALLLTVLTGFAGLVYEVAWQKYLAVLLGSHAEATAAVLAIFLGGLSLGYALFGRATRRLLERARRSSRPARLLRFYAFVEAGIGLYALLFPALFGVARKVSLLGGVEHAGAGFAYDVGLSALLIGPPAVLMGGTIPILSLALAGDLQRATRVHAWIYGCNTLGAFGGALAGGFFLVPWLGLDGVVYAMGLLNLAAAGVFAQLDTQSTPELSPPAAAEPVAAFAAWAGVALLAGFAMMTLQTTINRIGALALGSSEFTFAMVVAVFVLCIALGSLAVSALPSIPRWLVVGSQWMLVALLFLLYFVIADITYWAHVIRITFRRHEVAFYGYHLAVFGGLFALLALPIGLSGALLPMLFDRLRRQLRDLGSVAGRLYAWNTVGSLAGALRGGYVLFFWLDLHHIYRVAMAASAMAAALLSALVLRSSPRVVPAGVLLAALAGIWLLPEWPRERLTAGLYRIGDPQAVSLKGPDAFFGKNRATLLFYEDDPAVNVTVQQPRESPERRGILVNGKSDGSLSGDYPTMALLALIPALVAESYERSFVVGWGTGVTVGELAALEGAREIRVAEISRGVIAAAPFFEHGNLGASTNPKVDLRRGDAYRTLLRSPGQYDLIISEPSNPWVTGVEMLYSREFLEAARARLAPRGVFAQWFHLYASDPEVVSIVLRTYASVFPHVSVWYTMSYDVVLLGFGQPDTALDLEAMQQRFRQPDFAAGFGRVGIQSFAQLAAHEVLPLGTLHAVGLRGDLHTLRHPILSHHAARAFFASGLATIPRFLRPAHERVGSRNSLLGRLAPPGEPLPEQALEAAVLESWRFERFVQCSVLLARWATDYPDSQRRKNVLADIRKQAGAEAPNFTAAKLERLAALYESPAAELGDETTIEEAQALTNRYAIHYQHAVPFDRRVLDDAWRRCNGERCEMQRQAVMAELGMLPRRPGRVGPRAP